MTWRVALPGQPPTLNSLYTIVWRTDSHGRRYKGIGKNPDAQRWHDEMAMLIRVARPTGWAPAGMVRLSARLFYARDIDADNILKVLSDAVQTATGINDNRYLPTIECKHKVEAKDARIELTITEEGDHEHDSGPAGTG